MVIIIVLFRYESINKLPFKISKATPPYLSFLFIEQQFICKKFLIT